MSNPTEVQDRGIEPMGHINEVDGEKNLETVSVSSSLKEDKLNDEKAPHKVGAYEDVELDEGTITDPFKPYDDLPEERHWIVTFRAMVIGCICGALVNASNVYLGLKTGWTFGASLFGAIVGFAVLKPLSRALPENFPLLGGSFGPRENNIVQTAATAAGGLSSVMVSGIPALYQLHLMSTPKEDFGRLISLTVVGAYFGFAFATPLRKFFIIYVAKELNLIFPSPSACAMTIRSMHAAATGEAIAKLKMRALSYSFIGAVLLRVISQYATGILWDWHIFTWFFIWGKYNNAAMAVENWGWFLEFTPAFIGSGMLVGLNTAFSFFGGSVLAWGIIGPALVHNNIAFGVKPYEGDPKWDAVVSFYSLSPAWANKDTPSPRYWLLWPGVLAMIVISFTELFLQYKVFIIMFKAIGRGALSGFSAFLKAAGKENSRLAEKTKQDDEFVIMDSAEDHELVKIWMWGPILILTIICSCVVMGVQYDMPVGMSLLSVFLAFFFAILAVQCAGVTDITPLTAASKASQLVLGGATKSEHWVPEHAQRLNLIGGSLASIGAGQASDLVGDFRVGYLLRTSPKQQWIAQGLGTIVACILAPAMFMLFSKAYPCIIDIEADKCPFQAPSVGAWRAVAVAVTDPVFPVPKTSGYFAIAFAILGGVMVVIRHFAYTGSWEKYKAYHPNMMCIALAFVLNATVYGTAMVMGAVPAYFWAKKYPKHFDIYGFAVAAGLIAGEGIGGVINAIFQVAGIAGPSPYGTNIACPGDSC